MTRNDRPAADRDELRDRIREKYGEAARQADGGEIPSCCGSGFQPRGPRAPSERTDPITRDLYTGEETAGLPPEAVTASLGCGNPTALAELREGEAVLDLGSGGGVDVLLSARRVGPSGTAFPDASVDVVLSNCVINLSADKARVLREAFRVLRPGGRFAVSDVVVRGPVPAAVRESVESWIGCVAGALEEDEYRRLLAEAGFEEVEVEPTRVYRAEDARGFLEAAGLDPGEAADAMDGRFMAAFVRARKPDGNAGS